MDSSSLRQLKTHIHQYETFIGGRSNRVRRLHNYIHTQMDGGSWITNLFHKKTRNDSKQVTQKRPAPPSPPDLPSDKEDNNNIVHDWVNVDSPPPPLQPLQPPVYDPELDDFDTWDSEIQAKIAKYSTIVDNLQTQYDNAWKTQSDNAQTQSDNAPPVKPVPPMVLALAPQIAQFKEFIEKMKSIRTNTAMNLKARMAEPVEPVEVPKLDASTPIDAYRTYLESLTSDTSQWPPQSDWPMLANKYQQWKSTPAPPGRKRPPFGWGGLMYRNPNITLPPRKNPYRPPVTIGIPPRWKSDTAPKYTPPANIKSSSNYVAFNEQGSTE